MLPPAAAAAADADGDDGAPAAAAAQRPHRLTLDAAAGALAGCVSRFLVGPLDVVKIRFQVQLEPIRAQQQQQQQGGGGGGGGGGFPHAGGKASASSSAAAGGLSNGGGRPPPPRPPSHYVGFANAFRTIVAEEGVRGLWSGTVPGLLLTVPYTAVQFVALQQCKEAAARLGWGGGGGGAAGAAPSPGHSAAVSFASGALAGAAATVASYPFDLLRTTLAAQGEPKVYRGMGHAARAIVADQGLRGLYRGLGVTLVEIMPYAALQFGLYDAFSGAWDRAAAARRRRRQQHEQQQHEQQQQQDGGGGGGRRKHGHSKQQQQQQHAHAAAAAAWYDDRRLQAFACGLAAGLLAKLGSHPLDVAKKRYQVAGLPRSLRYGARVERRVAVTPLLSCLADIHAREGLAGLWKGSVPSIVKAAPAAAITFAAYEALLGLMMAHTGGGGGGGGTPAAAAARQEASAAGGKQQQQRRKAAAKGE